MNLNKKIVAIRRQPFPWTHVFKSENSGNVFVCDLGISGHVRARKWYLFFYPGRAGVLEVLYEFK